MKIGLVPLVLSLAFLPSLCDSQADVNQSPADANGIDSYASVILRSFSNSAALPPKKEFITSVNAHMLICNIVEEYEMEVMRREPGPAAYSYLPVKKTDPPTENISIAIPRGNLDSWGSVFSVRFNKGSGRIQIGIFPDPNSAITVFAEHILHTSMGPNRNALKALGDISAGWWDERYKGFRRLLFIRDNAVVNVHLSLEKLITSGISSGTTMTIAEAIDTALAEGTLGVRRGKVLKVPRILKIETPTQIHARSKVEAKVHIAVPANPQDANSKDAEVVRMLPFHVPSVSRGAKAQEDKTLTYEVTYISPDCIVTSKQVKVTIIPTALPGKH